MKRIYLVRHAECLSQTTDPADYLNPGLTELGKRQAERLVEPLRNIDVEAIILSPLRRVYQTYQISRAAAPHVEFDSRIVEIVSGYERILPVKTPDIAVPDRHNAWLVDAKERCGALLRDLLSGPYSRILVLGHGAIFSYFFKAFTGCHDGDFFMRTDNTGISILEAGGEIDRQVWQWNHTAHVADLLP